MAPRTPPGTVAAYAEVVGRLAHRFADRAAVLAARGLDESAFGALEDEALAALEASLREGDRAAAVSFVEAVVRSRLALLGGGDAVDPITVAASTARAYRGFGAVAAPIDTPTNARVEPSTPSSAPTSVPSSAPSPAPVDVLDLMETLHSTAGGRPKSST